MPERVGSSEGLGLDGERLLMRPMMRRATLFVKALGLEPLRAPALAGHGRVAWSLCLCVYLRGPTRLCASLCSRYPLELNRRGMWRACWSLNGRGGSFAASRSAEERSRRAKTDIQCLALTMRP